DLGDIQYVINVFVNANKESHFDISADVILTDQAILLKAINLQFLNRDVHNLHFVKDRNYIHTSVEGYFSTTNTGTDNRFTLRNFLVEICKGKKDNKKDKHNATNEQ